MALHNLNGNFLFFRVIYSTWLDWCFSGYVTFLSGYDKTEALSMLRYVCCVKQRVTLGLGPLHDWLLDPHGGMVDKIPIYKKLSWVNVPRLVGPLVGFFLWCFLKVRPHIWLNVQGFSFLLCYTGVDMCWLTTWLIGARSSILSASRVPLALTPFNLHYKVFHGVLLVGYHMSEWPYCLWWFLWGSPLDLLWSHQCNQGR